MPVLRSLHLLSFPLFISLFTDPNNMKYTVFTRSLIFNNIIAGKKLLLPFSICFIFSAQTLRAQIYDTLPVIFHIINNGESVGTGTNLSQAQVNSQFDVLNEDFRMLNADVANTPSVWMPLAGDMGLNFDKALVDPNGNILTEPGIDRVNRYTMGWTAGPYNMSYIDNTIKPQSVWDPYRYLNIWVMNVGNGLLGYCTFPVNSGLCGMPNGTADTLRDGIVLHYQATGRTGNLQIPYDKGRTATYEIAQWLGLKRLCQSSCGSDCVADTPVGDYSYGGCVLFPQVSTPCSNGPNGDMFMNFMSYVDDSCKYMFTLGQKGRIDTTLTNGVFQSALRLSNVVSGIKNISPFGKVSVFPDPASEKCCISFSKNITCTMNVYSLPGEKIYSTLISNSERTEIPVSHLPNGVYLLEFAGAKGVYTQKLVVQHAN